MRDPRRHTRRYGTTAAVALLGAGLAALPAIPAAADATGEGNPVVINEAYLDGSTSASPLYLNRWVELYNPSDAAVTLDGMSLQYRSGTGTSTPTTVLPLDGEIAAGGYYLISVRGSDTGQAEIPEPDATTGSAFSGSRGTVILAEGTTALTLTTGDVAGADGVIDLLGYGSSNTFETAAAVSPTISTSLTRTDAADTDDNSADFSRSETPTPTNSAGAGDDGSGDDGSGDDGETGTDLLTIAEIQGTGSSTPYRDQEVSTRGVVTAAFPEGGLNGYYIQTAGSGGADDATPGASDGVLVYSYSTVGDVELGDYVEVTGEAVEYNGLTEISVPAGGLTVLEETAEAVTATELDWAALSTEEREAHEGELILPTGDFTISDTYDLNAYGELLLAAGDGPLLQPTEVAAYGSVAYEAQIAENAQRALILDDGSSWNYVTNSTAQDSPLPYLDPENPLRSGDALSFDQPVVLSYGYGAWRVQPQAQIIGDDSTFEPVAFGESTRPAAPEVDGDVTIATFNVLNYFPTTGDERTNCTYYSDREGDPVTVRDSSDPGCQVRGAAEQEDLERQQAKIVTAINELDADVVSLEEIENSGVLGQDRDAALETLVDALNAAGGRWDYVPSPAVTPEDEDVIRLAMIYDPKEVKLVGDSEILVGSEAFSNAREPLAQAFTPKKGPRDVFVVIGNHFKSKSSSNASGDNVDAGQGAYNGDRTRQAEALVEFADEVAADAGTEKVFLVGDFNAYGNEDPVLALKAAGYEDLGARTGEYTYSFDGLAGSLDHVFASPAAAERVVDQDVWTINAPESVALEYSRHNYNVVDFYAVNEFRSSDHDPVVVGYDALSGREKARELSGR